MDVVTRLEQICIERGIGYYKLMKLTNLSPYTVYSWKNREAEPTLNSLVKVLRALNVTAEEFFIDFNENKLTDKQTELLQKWLPLSHIEKEMLIMVIDTMKVIRKRKRFD